MRALLANNADAAIYQRALVGEPEPLARVEPRATQRREPEREPDPLDIAIVGMDGFFPGAIGLDQFWASIVAGTDAVTSTTLPAPTMPPIPAWAWTISEVSSSCSTWSSRRVVTWTRRRSPATSRRRCGKGMSSR